MDQRLEGKLADLRNRIRKLDGALIAYSGGVDSTLLLRICREELGNKAVAVTALPENYPASELMLARRVARIIGARHVIYRPKQPVSCKGKIYGSLKGLAAHMKLGSVLDGSHKDDASEKGFGFMAASNLGIRSPLLESGLSKAEVRLLAKEFGLPNWDKLASAKPDAAARRVPLIKMVAAARRYLVSTGFRACSLLVIGRNIRISGTRADFERLSRRMSVIQKKMRSLGFAEVLIMLAS